MKVSIKKFQKVAFLATSVVLFTGLKGCNMTNTSYAMIHENCKINAGGTNVAEKGSPQSPSSKEEVDNASNEDLRSFKSEQSEFLDMYVARSSHSKSQSSDCIDYPCRELKNALEEYEAVMPVLPSSAKRIEQPSISWQSCQVLVMPSPSEARGVESKNSSLKSSTDECHLQCLASQLEIPLCVLENKDGKTLLKRQTRGRLLMERYWLLSNRVVEKASKSCVKAANNQPSLRGSADF